MIPKRTIKLNHIKYYEKILFYFPKKKKKDGQILQVF